ncbi:MAG: family 20 glycosylhydrolase [Verrucomicrobiae bacterium]|nr:family 20 glycosylhydrolase [Verrucomicrobiae bacterium]MCP5533496.1 family 20 glycosylhydrolase [Akkermansiaceae bacterium]MCP5544487.1 family 20 glycosylhydrolase [Akkermansiaceae bacterium]MCP5546461.1 family 20 glycosylhydrolase [Akkermansiaceae bacterium]
MFFRLRRVASAVLIGTGTTAYAANGWTLPTPKTDTATAPLIPYPAKVVLKNETIRFSGFLPGETIPEGVEHAAWIRGELADVCSDLKIPRNHKSGACHIVFERKPSGTGALSKEAYTLAITDGHIKIGASEFGGFFNALQTLRQLVKAGGDGFALPQGRIEDAPAFEIRGVMLDVGRNHMPVAFVKDMVRRLARYKINLLHLHLTDDPGWRFQTRNSPQLTAEKSSWPTRQPGKFYTQEELKELVAFCAKLNVRVVPEIDMPGHSAAFTRAMGFGMQTPQGLAAMKEVVGEAAAVFPDPLFHIGSDEVRVHMKEFMPEMVARLRTLGKEVVCWHPGNIPDQDAVLMCWGDNEAGHSLSEVKNYRYIDCNGFYLDWMDSQSGVLQTFFQQPCEAPRGNGNALGGVLCVWTDGALSSERRILEQYPFYPVALTFAERLWRGAAEKRRDLMATFPQKGTAAWAALDEFENRLIWHRDHAFRREPFAYVKQSEIRWRLIGPFNHKGVNDTSFEPEKVIKDEYICDGRTLKWNESPAYGGAVWFRHLWAMFNMHRNQYRLDHWPTPMSEKLGKDSGTCYALTYVHSPIEQDVHLMFGLNGMWGHSGGYRSARAPEPGSWDFSGGNIWLNDKPVPAPHWKFKSLPWTDWGKGRIEVPLTGEGYFFRPPVKIHLRKGVNKILVRSVFGHWKGDEGERKWFFCAMPVQWDGCHFTEVTNLTYPYPVLNGMRQGATKSETHSQKPHE